MDRGVNVTFHPSLPHPPEARHFAFTKQAQIRGEAAVPAHVQCLETSQRRATLRRPQSHD